MKIKECSKCGSKDIDFSDEYINFSDEYINGFYCNGFYCFCKNCHKGGPIGRNEKHAKELWNESLGTLTVEEYGLFVPIEMLKGMNLVCGDSVYISECEDGDRTVEELNGKEKQLIIGHVER